MNKKFFILILFTNLAENKKMKTLSFVHHITEKRNFGEEVVVQSLEVTVDYDPEEKNLDIRYVRLYENGKHIAEISKLLDNAEGQPLSVMVESINWDELYNQS